MRYCDLTGRVFGRLTCIEYAGRDRQGLSLWKCRCVCGKETLCRSSSLKAGLIKSCGCLQRDNAAIRCYIHGKSRTRLYKTWKNMKSRCNNPNASKYENYGGRGISVCQKWFSFERFYEWAMANGYDDSLSIDRIDNNGNYEPGNCRWVSVAKQNMNKRDNRLLTFNGITLTVKEWADKIGISYSSLSCRLINYGWSIEEALTLPKNTKVRYAREIN